MAACEKCWRDANSRALHLGGYVSDHYAALLKERESRPCTEWEQKGYRAPCDCIAAGNTEKPKQHGADPHAKNCAIYTGAAS